MSSKCKMCEKADCCLQILQSLSKLNNETHKVVRNYQDFKVPKEWKLEDITVIIYEKENLVVKKFTHNGKKYLIDEENTIYDIHTKDEIGIWDVERKAVYYKEQGNLEDEEEEGDEISVAVKRFTHEGVMYLRDDENMVYDMNTQDEIGKWNESTKTIDKF